MRIELLFELEIPINIIDIQINNNSFLVYVQNFTYP